MANNLTDVVTRRVDLVHRGAVRDPDDTTEPARFLLYKAEDGDSPAKGQPGGVCATCDGKKTIRQGNMKCPACGGTGIVPASGPLNKAEKFDPDGDGDDDSSPETDTDHDFWTAQGQPIAAAWKAAGKPVPAAQPISKSEDSWDREWSMATGAIAKTENDPNVGGGVDRDKLPASAFAGPNRSFPIVEPQDVADAASSLGRAGSDQASAADKATLRARVKAAIIRIAKSKGAAFAAKLPDAWTTATATAKAENDPTAGATGVQPTTTGDTEMPDEVKTDPVVEPATINKAELSPEVRAYLEKSEADAKALRSELDATKTTLDDVSKIAKAEQDLRVHGTFMRKAEELAHLPLTFDAVAMAKAEDGTERGPVELFAGALRELHEKAPGAEAILLPMLQTADLAMAKSELFREFGSGAGGSSQAGSAQGRVKALATEIQKSEKAADGSALSYAQAYDIAVTRDPELYESTRALPELGRSR